MFVTIKLNIQKLLRKKKREKTELVKKTLF